MSPGYLTLVSTPVEGSVRLNLCSRNGIWLWGKVTGPYKCNDPGSKMVRLPLLRNPLLTRCSILLVLRGHLFSTGPTWRYSFSFRRDRINYGWNTHTITRWKLGFVLLVWTEIYKVMYIVFIVRRVESFL